MWSCRFLEELVHFPRHQCTLKKGEVPSIGTQITLKFLCSAGVQSGLTSSWTWWWYRCLSGFLRMLSWACAKCAMQLQAGRETDDIFSSCCVNKNRGFLSSLCSVLQWEAYLWASKSLGSGVGWIAEWQRWCMNWCPQHRPTLWWPGLTIKSPGDGEAPSRAPLLTPYPLSLLNSSSDC